MKIVKPSATILDPVNPKAILQKLERIGRLAYKSEDAIIETSASPFIRRLCQDLKHESVIEHVSLSVLFVCDRGVSHELVRHRLASFTQESTRYCNYSRGKFGGEITVIEPPGLKDPEDWEMAMMDCESAYIKAIEDGVTPQIARSVLPNSLKTEIVVTANLREWRHIFKMRTSKAAHPQMRELMIPLLIEFRRLLPEIFDDINENILNLEDLNVGNRP